MQGLTRLVVEQSGFGAVAGSSSGGRESVWALHEDLLDRRDTAVSLGRERRDVTSVEGAFVVPNVLSEAECRALIDVSERIGFTSGEETVNVPKEIRDNEAVVFVPPTGLLQELSRRLAPFVPGTVESKATCSQRCDPFINGRFRIYRYSPPSAQAQPHRFAPHFDGANAPSSVQDGKLTEDSGHGTSKSWMSVLLYLTGGHQGGETVFFPTVSDPALAEAQTAPEERIRVSPQAGAALCFFHGDHPLSPVHEGAALAPAEQERKYVIRTDVLYYSKPKESQAEEWHSNSTAMAMLRAAALS